MLSRFVTPAQQRQALEGFAAGTVNVLIGTHRLLSADVNPHDLGLVIIDEEQRFGVQHKEQLKNMREQVDVLTLSATPIPRTMQMAMSGVRDMSLIMTPPPGRLPVKVHVGEWDPDLVSAAIRNELERKGQVYYVSNRVTTIDDAVARVMEAAPEARVGVAHGKMSAREVEDVMLRFQEHEIDVLVATTIIESGIDNPRTNTLIIEDSQRLGLAQLYQLKGRVGRGRTQAYAYFMFPSTAPLTPEATDRLTAINEYQDLGSGMRIAMRDLEIRGAGSLMGAEQHGNLSSVGFDLFTQMLGEAVAEARGETAEVEVPEVTINLSADFYLAEEYMPEVDQRVLAYAGLPRLPSFPTWMRSSATSRRATVRCRLPVATSLTGRAFASARSAWAARPSRLPTGAWSTRGLMCRERRRSSSRSVGPWSTPRRTSWRIPSAQSRRRSCLPRLACWRRLAAETRRTTSRAGLGAGLRRVAVGGSAVGRRAATRLGPKLYPAQADTRSCPECVSARHTFGASPSPCRLLPYADES